MRRMYAAWLTMALAVVAAPGSAAAADKQHQQLMAEIRMLQEQQQQLQQMLGTLADSLKALNTRLDEQTAASRKAFADQTLQLNTIGDGVRVLREKVDDTNVRLSSLTQEMDSVRQAVAQVPPQSVSAPGTGATITDPTTGVGGAQPPGSNPANPIPFLTHPPIVQSWVISVAAALVQMKSMSPTATKVLRDRCICMSRLTLLLRHGAPAVCRMKPGGDRAVACSSLVRG